MSDDFFVKPLSIKVSIEYIEEVIYWLKKLKDSDKEKVIKSLHHLFSNFDKDYDLTFY